MALVRISDLTPAVPPLVGTELLELDAAGAAKSATAKDIANLAFGASDASATAGAGTALPATPVGYVEVVIGGNPFKIPYYSP